jgi:hypothetical protein
MQPTQQPRGLVAQMGSSNTMSNSDFRIKKKSPKVGPSITDSKSKSPPGHSSDAIG